LLICSGIRERYAQDERQPARGLRYQLTSRDRRDKRGLFRTKVNSTQPASASNRPDGVAAQDRRQRRPGSKLAPRTGRVGGQNATPRGRQRQADTQFVRYRIRLTILGDLPALTGLR
jgi:hypothetical protein